LLHSFENKQQAESYLLAWLYNGEKWNSSLDFTFHRAEEPPQELWKQVYAEVFPDAPDVTNDYLSKI